MQKCFILGKYSVGFKDDFVKYNELKRQYIELSKNAAVEFNDAFFKESITIQDIKERALEKGNDIILKNVEVAIKYLINNDIMEIDKDTFIEKYYNKFFTLDKDFTDIINFNFISKGSNIKEVAQSIINSVGNVIGDNYGKNNYIQEILEKLSNAIEDNVFKIHYALVDAMRENGKEYIAKYVVEENRKLSFALFNNFRDGLIPKDKEEIVVKEIIEKNPYNKELYMYLLNSGEASKKDIYEIIEFLSIDMSEEKSKEKEARTVDGIVFDTLEEAEVAKDELKRIQDIENKIKTGSESDYKEIIEEIRNGDYTTIIKDKHILELSEKLVETIEAEDRKIVESYYNTLVFLDQESMKRGIAKIRNLDVRTKKVKEEKIRYIVSRSEKIIKRHRILLERAKRYEVRVKALKTLPKEEKNALIRIISKTIEKGNDIIEDLQERSEREAWRFITNNGTRSIEDVEENRI